MAAVFRRAPEVWEEMGDAIFAELFGGRRDPARGALLSDEAIGRLATDPRRLAVHLAAMERAGTRHGFDRLHVVAVLRRQDTWLASHYAQVSDRRPGAGQADFERLVAAVLDPARQRFALGMVIDHGALLGALVDALGRGRVCVLAHEALAADPEGAATRLLGGLGTPPGEVRRIARALDERRSNARTSRPGRWTLRPRRLGVLGRDLRVPARLDPRRGGSIALTPDLSARILDAYAPSNRAAARIGGLDLAGHGYLGDAT